MRRHAILGSDFRSKEGRHHATTHRRHTPAVSYTTVPHPSHGRYAHAEQVYNLYFLKSVRLGIFRAIPLGTSAAYTFNPRVNPTLAKLRKLPNPRYNPLWPEGTRQPLTKALAEYFFSLLSTCDTSLLQLLRDHPELPPFKQLDYWRRHTPWFSDSWRKARQAQADFLVQKCLDLAKACTPKNAHVIRVQVRYLPGGSAPNFHPEIYGDGHKPAAPTSTTVNVGIAISPECLRIFAINSTLLEVLSLNTVAEAMKLNLDMDNPADREKLRRAVLDLVAGRKMPKQQRNG